jgi:hypothetical protein
MSEPPDWPPATPTPKAPDIPASFPECRSTRKITPTAKKTWMTARTECIEPKGSDARELERALRANPTLVALLERARALALPDWYLAAGAIFQTVWNHVTGRDPEHGIRDYDLIYHDASDLSWEPEDAVIQRVADPRVEVRNQARVHLWYEQKFGIACPPLPTTEAGIDTYPGRACAIGVRLNDDDTLHVYAPYGLADTFALVLRPNPVLAPRAVYEAKAARWQREWPELRVEPWPG